MQGLFFSALLLFFVLYVDNVALSVVTHATSIRYDQYIFCFDRVLGSPSFPIGRLFAAHPLFHDVSLFAYILAPTVCLGTASACFFLLPLNNAVACVRTIFLSCLLAYPMYVIFPVAGPKYAFPNFPSPPPAHLVPKAIYQVSIPNGVPSVHMTLALMVFWFARPWRVGRVLGSIFVLLTVSATLGTGEHYVFDLIVAVPYSALMIYLGGYSDKNVKDSQVQRRTAELAGLV
jgi:hypothetical protein